MPVLIQIRYFSSSGQQKLHFLTQRLQYAVTSQNTDKRTDQGDGDLVTENFRPLVHHAHGDDNAHDRGDDAQARQSIGRLRSKPPRAGGLLLRGFRFPRPSDDSALRRWLNR